MCFADAGVFNDDGSPCPPGESGELWLYGEQLFSCYWRNPDATAACRVNGWFRGGDLAVRDEEGFFYIRGRKSDLINSGGEKVLPGEVEEAISRMPGVAQVAVLGISDPRWGEKVVAAVVPRAGLDVSPEAVMAHCRGELAGFKVPREVRALPALPVNAAGKVDRSVLKKQWPELQP